MNMHLHNTKKNIILIRLYTSFMACLIQDHKKYSNLSERILDFEGYNTSLSNSIFIYLFVRVMHLAIDIFWIIYYMKFSSHYYLNVYNHDYGDET